MPTRSAGRCHGQTRIERLRAAQQKVERLWLFTPEHASFYARLGFVPVATQRDPTSDAEYMIMRRDATPITGQKS